MLFGRGIDDERDIHMDGETKKKKNKHRYILYKLREAEKRGLWRKNDKLREDGRRNSHRTRRRTQLKRSAKKNTR
jgi:hypothetical protein